MASSVSFIVAVTLLAGLTSAHRYSFGRCNSKPGMSGFQPAQLEGRWYVVAISSSTSHCITMDFTPTEEGLAVNDSREWALFRMLGVDTDIKSSTVLTPTNPNNPSVMKASKGPTRLGFIDNADVSLLDTDYTTYAAIYECKNYFLFKREELAILSREPTLDDSILNKELSEAESLSIPTSDMSYVSHQNCLDQPDFEFDIGDIGDVFGGAGGDGDAENAEGGAGEGEVVDPNLDEFDFANPTENEVP